MPAWSTGLCDCFNDCGLCCYGWCCTPCLFGENAEKIDGTNCVAAGLIWYLLTGLGCCCVYHMGKRRTLRQRYGLEEGCGDCAITTFCASCAICQEARELKIRETFPAATGAVISQPMAYQTNKAADQF